MSLALTSSQDATIPGIVMRLVENEARSGLPTLSGQVESILQGLDCVS